MIELTKEDYRIIDLRYRINYLNRIATLIPTRRMILRANPLNNLTFKKTDTVDYERYNIGKYLSFGEKNNDTIIEFIKKLENYSDIINLNTLYINLKSLKVSQRELDIIEKLEKKLGLSTSSGYYLTERNIINLNIDNNGLEKETLTHELIHFASTVKQNNIVYTGFSQRNKGLLSDKGRGINEGTTEFINKTLFNYQNNSYEELVYIVTGISNLIGIERLIQLYFDNDLKGLIEEISKYSDNKTAVSIINGMDKIYNINYENIKSRPSTTPIALSKNIVSLIATINLKKQKELLKNNEITEEEYKKEEFEKVVLYELKCPIRKTTNSANKTLYEINNIPFTEKEYMKIIEGYNEKTVEPGLGSNQKNNYLIESIRQVRKERIELIENDDKIYGSSKGFKDNDGNSLDGVNFVYKKLDKKIVEAINEGKSILEVIDTNGIIHRIGFTEAINMSNMIGKSAERNYVNLDFDDNKEKNGLKDIIDDYDKSLKETESNINREK